MDKKLVIKTYISFLLIWGLDYLIKGWFKLHGETFNWGWIRFSYAENYGIAMGGFTSLPLILKSVFLTTLGAALIASLPMATALYKFRKNYTIYGLSLLLSGVLGNVTDRVLYGFVVDYIYLSTPVFTTPILNLADIVQWFGYALLFFGILHEVTHHYPEENKRNAKWIDKKFQLKFVFSLMAIYIPIYLIFVAFGYTFIKYSLIELKINMVELDHYLKFYSMTSAILLVFSSIVVFLTGKIISQRIAGPITAIKRYTNDTLMRKRYPLKFREHDHFQELEGPLTLINSELTEEKKERA